MMECRNRNLTLATGALLLILTILFGAATHVKAESVTVDTNLTTVSEPNSPPQIQSLPWQADIVVGERLNLQVTSRDDDNTVPRLLSGKLPEGSFLTENRDGSRSLLWKPDAGQVGEHRIVFTAMDSRDPALRSERLLILNVVSPAQ